MTPSIPARPARGSTLVLTLVLLAVLSVIGVAAVALSSQERTNAAVKTHQDRLRACAQAAQASFWSEILRYGPGYTDSDHVVPEIKLPDGTVLKGGHYHDDGTVVIKTDVKVVPCKNAQTEEFMDLTNRDSAFSIQGSCIYVTARCRDPQGRELEIEFGINKLF